MVARQPAGLVRICDSSLLGSTSSVAGPPALPVDEVVMSEVYQSATLSFVTSGVSSTTADSFTPSPANRALTSVVVAVASCGGVAVMPTPL